jgi:hypothetical protein
MRDHSWNLPQWAWERGYRLLGNCGTFDDLYLVKDPLGDFLGTIKIFPYNKIPTIYEIEDIIKELENGRHHFSTTSS